MIKALFTFFNNFNNDLIVMNLLLNTRKIEGKGHK